MHLQSRKALRTRQYVSLSQKAAGTDLVPEEEVITKLHLNQTGVPVDGGNIPANDASAVMRARGGGGPMGTANNGWN